MKVILTFGTVSFLVLFVCSRVHSASPPTYFSCSDTFSARGLLLDALKKLFTAVDVFIPEKTAKPIVSEKNRFHVFPSKIIYLIEKYLEPNDVLNFSLLSKEIKDVVLNDAAIFNLYAFCPHFVIPEDLLLSRIFYFTIIKKLGVDSITDAKIFDALHLMTLKRVGKDLPAPKGISQAIFDQMFMCLFEAVNGLNSRVPLSHDTQRSYFSEQYKHHDLPRTRKYIQERIGNDVYNMNMMDFISSEPNEIELKELLEYKEDEEVLYKLTVEFLKFIVDFELKTTRIIPTSDYSRFFLALLKKGEFSFELFDKINAIKDHGTIKKFFVKIRKTFNLKAVHAFNLKYLTDGYLRSRAYYAITRTAIDPLDFYHFDSLGGEICKGTFNDILHDQSTNLTIIDLFTQMIRFGHIDLTSLKAPHRTFVLNSILTSPNHDLANIILSELPGSLNLMTMPKSDNNETSYSPISLSNLSKKSLELVVNHLRSKSDDPLPLLFYSQDDMDGIGSETIRDKFDLNKKYLFDYDFDLFKVPLFFMRNMSEEQILELKGTMMDFKTIVERMSVLTPGIKSYFTSNPEIFSVPTPSNVKPISLKRYFEDVVFEVVNMKPNVEEEPSLSSSI